MVAMKSNTALTFVLAGLALWQHVSGLGARRPALVLATLVSLVGLVTLGEYLLETDFGIDQLLFRETDFAGNFAPGRMSPITAFCFAAYGFAMFATPARLRRLWRELPALLTVLASLIAVLGYLFGVKALYAIGPYTTMALHTAILLLLLGLGLFFAYPERGTMAVLVGDTVGGAMARRLLPVAVFVPLIVAWFRLLGQRAGLYGTEFGLSLVVVATITSMSAVIIRNAGSLAIEELHRRKTAKALRRANQRLERMVADKTRDLSLREHQLEEANRKLELLSLEDPLTGGGNRRGFEAALARESRRATRHEGPVSVIMIDIDYFKDFNDKYGHQAGDECLRRVARGLSETLARPGDVLSRYGGEEFVAILPSTPMAGAMNIANLMRLRIQGLGIEHLRSPKAIVSISLGVATSTPGGSMSAEDLVGAADKALYSAKRAGRDCVESADTVTV